MHQDQSQTPSLPTERRGQRRPVSIRVRSRELPDFQATSVDVSLYGIQLMAAAPLPVGRTLPLELELRGEAPIECRATVRWSRLTSPFLVGLEFERLDHSRLGRLMNFLQERTGENTMVAPEEPVLTLFVTHRDVMVSVEADLKNIVWHGDQLTLSLEEEGEAESWVFDEARLLVPEVVEGPLSGLLVRALSEDRFEYLFLGPSGLVYLCLSAAKPYRRLLAA